jgi:hypothetical protein
MHNKNVKPAKTTDNARITSMGKAKSTLLPKKAKEVNPNEEKD